MNLWQKNNLISQEVSLIIKNSLSEDIGAGDITTETLINQKTRILAKITTKDKIFVLCGLSLLKQIFKIIDKHSKVVGYFKDGDLIKNKKLICRISGQAKSILMAERTALNFLSRLSGIATRTYQIVQKVKPYQVKILDTRKTTPGLRILEKYAVRMGGGYNHRFGLFDQVLIKDNHLKIINLLTKNDKIDRIASAAKKKTAGKKIIEIEVNDLKKFKDALNASPDIIMLDNMQVNEIKKAVHIRNLNNKDVKLEVSGNINEENIVAVARTGVNFISLGSITHSVQSIDFSLEVEKIIRD